MNGKFATSCACAALALAALAVPRADRLAKVM